MVETPQQHVMALSSRWVRGLDVIRDRHGSGPAFCTVVTARAHTGAVVGSKRRTAHGARRIATSRRTARRTAHGPSESERRGLVGGGGGRPCGGCAFVVSRCRRRRRNRSMWDAGHDSGGGGGVGDAWRTAHGGGGGGR